MKINVRTESYFGVRLLPIQQRSVLEKLNHHLEFEFVTLANGWYPILGATNEYGVVERFIIDVDPRNMNLFDNVAITDIRLQEMQGLKIKKMKRNQTNLSVNLMGFSILKGEIEEWLTMISKNKRPYLYMNQLLNFGIYTLPYQST